MQNTGNITGMTKNVNDAIAQAKAQRAAAMGRNQVRTGEETQTEQESPTGRVNDRVDVKAQQSDQPVHDAGQQRPENEQAPGVDRSQLSFQDQVNLEGVEMFQMMNALPREDKEAIFNQVEKDMGEVARKQGLPTTEGMDLRPFVARRLNQYAVAKTNELAPGVSDPAQLRQMASENPQLALTAGLAQKSRNFMQGYNQVQQELSGASQPGASSMAGQSGGPPGTMPPGSTPPPGGGSGELDRATELSRRRQEMEQIRTIFMEMWAMMRKEQMKRWQIMQDVMTETTKIIMEASTHRAQTVSRAVDAFSGYLRS